MPCLDPLCAPSPANTCHFTLLMRSGLPNSGRTHLFSPCAQTVGASPFTCHILVLFKAYHTTGPHDLLFLSSILLQSWIFCSWEFHPLFVCAEELTHYSYLSSPCGSAFCTLYRLPLNSLGISSASPIPPAAQHFPFFKLCDYFFLTSIIYSLT